MTDTVKYIFAKSETVYGIEINPIQMKNYDEFMEIANILTVSYDSFDNSDNSLEGFKLLDLVLTLYIQLEQGEMVLDSFEKLFSFVCRQPVKFQHTEGDNFVFVLDNGKTINRDNYDEIRKVIMMQNLIFEPKVYKNKFTQEWVELALKARAQSALKISVESMIAVIVAFSGMDINILYNYSIYQIKTIFQTVLKMKNYDTSILFKSVGSDINIDHFAEEIDMHKNPYDDIIKEDSHHKHIKDSLNGKL